jgi:hypothetical protein
MRDDGGISRQDDHYQQDDRFGSRLQQQIPQYSMQSTFTDRSYEAHDSPSNFPQGQHSPTVKLARQRLITDVYGSAGINFGQSSTTEANGNWKPSRRGATDPSRRYIIALASCNTLL